MWRKLRNFIMDWPDEYFPVAENRWEALRGRLRPDIDRKWNNELALSLLSLTIALGLLIIADKDWLDWVAIAILIPSSTLGLLSMWVIPVTVEDTYMERWGAVRVPSDD